MSHGTSVCQVCGIVLWADFRGTFYHDGRVPRPAGVAAHQAVPDDADVRAFRATKDAHRAQVLAYQRERAAHHDED